MPFVIPLFGLGGVGGDLGSELGDGVDSGRASVSIVSIGLCKSASERRRVEFREKLVWIDNSWEEYGGSPDNTDG